MSNKRAFTCSQCGAPDLELSGEGKLRCPFCGSIYSYSVKGPTVIIRQGANVVFGKGANVVIKGGLEIAGGANVQVDGQITLLERAPEEVITAAKLQLQKPGSHHS